MEEAEPFAHHLAMKIGGDGHAHGEPLLLVVPAQPAVPGNQRVIVENVDAFMLRGQEAKPGVDPADGPGLTGFALIVEKSMAGHHRQLERVDDEAGGRAGAEGAQDRVKTFEHPGRDRSDGWFRKRDRVPEFGGDVPSLRGQDHHARIELIKPARRIEHFLRIRVELTNLHFQVDAAEHGRGAEDRHQRLDRKGA